MMRVLDTRRILSSRRPVSEQRAKHGFGSAGGLLGYIAWHALVPMLVRFCPHLVRFIGSVTSVLSVVSSISFATLCSRRSGGKDGHGPWARANHFGHGGWGRAWMLGIVVFSAEGWSVACLYIPITSLKRSLCALFRKEGSRLEYCPDRINDGELNG